MTLMNRTEPSPIRTLTPPGGSSAQVIAAKVGPPSSSLRPLRSRSRPRFSGMLPRIGFVRRPGGREAGGVGVAVGPLGVELVWIERAEGVVGGDGVGVGRRRGDVVRVVDLRERDASGSSRPAWRAFTSARKRVWLVPSRNSAIRRLAVHPEGAAVLRPGEAAPDEPVALADAVVGDPREAVVVRRDRRVTSLGQTRNATVIPIVVVLVGSSFQIERFAELNSGPCSL